MIFISDLLDKYAVLDYQFSSGKIISQFILSQLSAVYPEWVSSTELTRHANTLTSRACTVNKGT